MRLKEADLSARYPADHRPARGVCASRSRCSSRGRRKRSRTLTEITTGVDTNYQQLRLTLSNEQAQLDALVARQESLAADLEKQDEALTHLADKELELSRLERAVELAQKDHTQARDNWLRADNSYLMDKNRVSNVSIVQPATAWPDPVRPHKPLNIAIGIAAGAFLGLFWAFASQYLDDTLSTQDQIERRLNVPVLAVINEKAFKAGY